MALLLKAKLQVGWGEEWRGALLRHVGGVITDLGLVLRAWWGLEVVKELARMSDCTGSYGTAERTSTYLMNE
jgi:hypothetical protein